MRAPEPEADGLRRYGQWAGNPSGHIENTKHCIAEVYYSVGRAGFFKQCDSKRGHGENGLYCKRHDPVNVEARDQKRKARWAAQDAARDLRYKRDDAFKAIAHTALAYFDQKATFDDLEKAVIEYRKLMEGENV